MTSLATKENQITAMSPAAIAKVRSLEAEVAKLPQVDIETDHVIHGGMYARTILIPANVVLTGAEVNVASTLIVNGHCRVYANDQTLDIKGYHVIPASAGRKQAFVAFEDTYLTMIYTSNATTVKEAEDAMTDEPHMLMSRRDGAVNTITITGE